MTFSRNNSKILKFEDISITNVKILYILKINDISEKFHVTRKIHLDAYRNMLQSYNIMCIFSHISSIKSLYLNFFVHSFNHSLIFIR